MHQMQINISYFLPSEEAVWELTTKAMDNFCAQERWECYLVTYNLTCILVIGPGIFGTNFKGIIFKLIILKSIQGTRYEIVLIWMPHNLSNEKSTLVRVMAWCRQGTSHYLSQCWDKSMSPYGVFGPEWVNGYQTLVNYPCVAFRGYGITEYCFYATHRYIRNNNIFNDYVVNSQI